MPNDHRNDAGGSESKKSGLTSGAMAGVIAGVAAVVVLVLFIILMVVRDRKRAVRRLDAEGAHGGGAPPARGDMDELQMLPLAAILINDEREAVAHTESPDSKAASHGPYSVSTAFPSDALSSPSDTEHVSRKEEKEEEERE